LGVLLVILGVLNIFIGINVGFGDIMRLGLQGECRFGEVIDQASVSGSR